jgi:hypothetical protein
VKQNRPLLRSVSKSQTKPVWSGTTSVSTPLGTAVLASVTEEAHEGTRSLRTTDAEVVDVVLGRRTGALHVHDQLRDVRTQPCAVPSSKS